MNQPKTISTKTEFFNKIALQWKLELERWKFLPWNATYCMLYALGRYPGKTWSSVKCSLFPQCFKFSRKLFNYMFLSNVVLMKTNCPIPVAEMQPQTITFSSPCFIVEFKCAGFISLLDFLHTLTSSSEPNKLNFDSS